MVAVAVRCLLIFLLVSPACGFLFNNLKRGINGGVSCAVCTVFVGLVEQLAEIHNDTVTEALTRTCEYLPGTFQEACKVFIWHFGPYVIKMLDKKDTPDVVCFGLGLCFTQPGTEQCHLFPLPKEGINHRLQSSKPILKDYIRKFGSSTEFVDICDLPGIKYLCEYLKRVFSHHLPGLDLDGDGYSVLKALRGTSWRGRDCADTRKDIHPGKIPEHYDVREDTNCNGINGTMPHTGLPYEFEYCFGTQPRGIAVIGDSVGAHFHVPPEWLTPTLMNKKIFENLSFVIENEADWPQLSAGTGYMQSVWPVTRGPTTSLYLHLRDRNRCNHRDFQNLAVNGGNIFNVQQYQRNLSRNKKTDYPLLIIFELVGNDVCNHEHDTVQHMTTAAEMRTNLVKSLEYLDSRVPHGSFLFLIGMADGRVLYDLLHDRYHPIGQYRRDVTYADFYTWFGCLRVTPCEGWLSTNETLRNETSERARELSKVMKDTVEKYRLKLNNLEPTYMDCPIKQVIDEWIEEHGAGTGHQLIEPVDGFHPNQLANSLIAKYAINFMEKNVPHFLGDVNRHNREIEKVFGDQGGY